MMRFLLLITLIVCGFFSCKKDKAADAPDLGYDYYPTQKGRFVIYNCDSIVHYDVTFDTDTFVFQIKEIIDSTLTDNSGRPLYRISRYKKLQKINDSLIVNPYWAIQDVWWATKTSTTVEVVEENYRFVKLIFPTIKDKVWNGNAQNNLGSQDYTYTEVDEPATFGTLTFQKSLSVDQSSSLTSILSLKKYSEKYARGVGLIYKELKDYTWKQNFSGVLIGQIKEGLYYKMTIESFGVQ